MSLRGKIAVVTGASRGIGRGIALQLGAAGAKVYVTGREPKKSLSNQNSSLPSLDKTAQEVTESGGEGIIAYVDHSDMSQVKELFERIERENNGQLDILVNNAYSAITTINDNMDKKFYESDPEIWDDVNNVGLRNHYYCSVYATRLMRSRGQGGFIVNISSVGGLKYLYNVPYGVGKAASDRMAADMAEELRKENITVISLWPGPIETELLEDLGMVSRFDSEKSAGTPKDVLTEMYTNGESTQFAGLCIVALANDPKLHSKTGRTLLTADLGHEYGFKDINGREIQSMRSVSLILRILNVMPWMAKVLPRWLKVPGWLIVANYSKL